MNLEQSFFLKLLSDHLNRRLTNISSENIDWRLILHYAQIQQVEGIIFSQCKSFLPNDVRIQFQEKYSASLFYYANREYYVKAIIKSLKANQINFFIIKGFPVASLYPIPALRTMSDTDLVVQTKDRRRVNDILLSQGYINTSHRKNREWIYYKDKYELELHDRLIYNEAINSVIHEDFFGNAWDYVHNAVLDWNYHFLFLILHLRKHLMNCGVGFRQFLDIAVVTNNCRDLDWDWIEEKLVKLNLIDFSKIVFALNESWFDIKSPIHISTLDSTFYERVTEQVFNNGVFGFENEENKANVVINNARKSKNAKKYMFTTAFHTLFPSYSKMITVPEYSFLRGKGWLLPFVWIYRIIRGVKHSNFSRNVIIVKSSFVSNETLEQREEYLRQWGLYDIE